jgi:ribosomal protein S27AE
MLKAAAAIPEFCPRCGAPVLVARQGDRPFVLLRAHSVSCHVEADGMHWFGRCIGCSRRWEGVEMQVQLREMLSARRN